MYLYKIIYKYMKNLYKTDILNNVQATVAVYVCLVYRYMPYYKIPSKLCTYN